jgi:uncharacterized protein (DUF952 family)/predicted DNA-binding protein (MmcQ/YjbR family)
VFAPKRKGIELGSANEEGLPDILCHLADGIADNVDDLIFHITPAAAWAESADPYAPPEFEREGFVHCSTQRQVIEVANALFCGRSDLVLLMIDTARIKGLVRYGNSSGRAESFLHVYSSLPRDAIVAVEPLEARKDGSFEPRSVQRCLSLARLRKYCLSLPETTETDSWGHPNFRVGKRTFAAFEWIKGRPSIAIRLDAAELDSLLLQRADVFATPYGQGLWISVPADTDPDWDFLRELLERGYRKVALKRMIKALEDRES